MGNAQWFYDTRNPVENDPRVCDYWKGCSVYKLYKPHQIRHTITGEQEKVRNIEYALRLPNVSTDLFLALNYFAEHLLSYELYLICPYNYDKYVMHMTIDSSNTIKSQMIYGKNCYDSYKSCSGLEGLMFIRYNILEYFHNTRHIQRTMTRNICQPVKYIEFTDASAVPIKYSNNYKFLFYERTLNPEISINRISIYDKYTEEKLDAKEHYDYIAERLQEARKFTYGDFKDMIMSVDVEASLKKDKNCIVGLEEYINGTKKHIDYNRYSDNMLLGTALKLSEELERRPEELRFVDIFYKFCPNIMDGLAKIWLYTPKRKDPESVVNNPKFRCGNMLNILDDIWESHRSLRKRLTYESLHAIFKYKELL
jgi:hypothetical protein